MTEPNREEECRKILTEPIDWKPAPGLNDYPHYARFFAKYRGFSACAFRHDYTEWAFSISRVCDDAPWLDDGLPGSVYLGAGSERKAQKMADDYLRLAALKDFLGVVEEKDAYEGVIGKKGVCERKASGA